MNYKWPCEGCVKQHTMDCPNSLECYALEDRPHFLPKSYGERASMIVFDDLFDIPITEEDKRKFRIAMGFGEGRFE